MVGAKSVSGYSLQYYAAADHMARERRPEARDDQVLAKLTIGLFANKVTPEAVQKDQVSVCG